jgi:hypothetical protein
MGMEDWSTEPVEARGKQGSERKEGSRTYGHPHVIHTIFLFLSWCPTMQVEVAGYSKMLVSVCQLHVAT